MPNSTENKIRAFSFLDRDPRQVGEQLARELPPDAVTELLGEAKTWLASVRMWERYARRQQKEKN